MILELRRRSCRRKCGKTRHTGDGGGRVALSQQLPLFYSLIAQRFKKPRLRGRGAVRIADAEFLELRGIAREGAVVERDREADAAAVAHGDADAVDRSDELWVVGMAADAERARQVGGTDREQVDAVNRGDFLDLLDRLR